MSRTASWNRAGAYLVVAAWLSLSACDGSNPPQPDIRVTFDGWERWRGAYNLPEYRVNVRVSSTSPVTGITAENVGISQPVAMYEGTPGRWHRSLKMVVGDNPLRFQATDDHGNTAGFDVLVILDRPPVITVLEPAESSLADPTIHVSATCSDDLSAGCTMFTVSAWDPFCDPYFPLSCEGFPSGRVLLRGTDEISGVVDLSAFAGLDVVWLSFDAIDSTDGYSRAGVHLQVSAPE